MALRTKQEIDEMMALPMAERPAGWAWWKTAEMAAEAAAFDAAQEKAAAERKAARLAKIAAANAMYSEPKHGPGWCNKCHSYCYGDCQA